MLAPLRSAMCVGDEVGKCWRQVQPILQDGILAACAHEPHTCIACVARERGGTCRAHAPLLRCRANATTRRSRNTGSGEALRASVRAGYPLVALPTMRRGS